MRECRLLLSCVGPAGCRVYRHSPVNGDTAPARATHGGRDRPLSGSDDNDRRSCHSTKLSCCYLEGAHGRSLGRSPCRWAPRKPGTPGRIDSVRHESDVERRSHGNVIFGSFVRDTGGDNRTDGCHDTVHRCRSDDRDSAARRCGDECRCCRWRTHRANRAAQARGVERADDAKRDGEDHQHAEYRADFARPAPTGPRTSSSFALAHERILLDLALARRVPDRQLWARRDAPFVGERRRIQTIEVRIDQVTRPCASRRRK